MTTGIILLNFGEPPVADEERVENYLERIFLANGDLEDDGNEQSARERARRLAERRATGLATEYDAIGGSPLVQQSSQQATDLENVCRDRGFGDVETYVGMQYTSPFIADAVEAAQADDVDQLVGLPVYPLCGPSTTIAALRDLSTAVAERDWGVETVNLTGWHRHPLYLRLRTDTVRTFATNQGLDLASRGTELVFSAHGTPQHYLDVGSRYVEYVEEWCELVADSLGLDDYTLGFQNHENRGVQWTEPSVEEALETVDAARIVVEPVSFVHEQSETLWDLDREVHDLANDIGLDFYRVPVPHDDQRLPVVLADLVEPILAGVDPAVSQLRPCGCTDRLDALCRTCSHQPGSAR